LGRFAESVVEPAPEWESDANDPDWHRRCGGCGRILDGKVARVSTMNDQTGARTYNRKADGGR